MMEQSASSFSASTRKYRLNAASSDQTPSNVCSSILWSALSSILPSNHGKIDIFESLMQINEFLRNQGVRALRQFNLDQDTDPNLNPIYVGEGASYRVYAQE